MLSCVWVVIVFLLFLLVVLLRVDEAVATDKGKLCLVDTCV